MFVSPQIRQFLTQLPARGGGANSEPVDAVDHAAHGMRRHVRRPRFSASRLPLARPEFIVAAERAVRRRVAAVATDIQARIVQLLASLGTAGALEGRLRPFRPHP